MDNEPTILLMLLVFSVPILAILSRFVTRWRALGTSNGKLVQQVERLEKANEEYAQRLENLETVVASQTSNVLQQPGPVPTGPHQLEEMNTQRVAHLARRIGG